MRTIHVKSGIITFRATPKIDCYPKYPELTYSKNVLRRFFPNFYERCFLEDETDSSHSEHPARILRTLQVFNVFTKLSFF